MSCETHNRDNSTVAALLRPSTDELHNIEFLRHLEASRERLELALRAADLGLWDWDVVTNDVVFSERYATMLGYAPGEIEPRFDGFLLLLHPDDTPNAMGNVNEVFAGLQPEYQNRFRLRAKDGTYRWIEARGWAIFDSAGRPIRMLGTHRDITREREAQEEMQRAKEAALEAAQAKTDFLATMSHEIRTPLNAVIGLGSLLIETELSERQREMVETIRSSSQSLLALVNDILDFSKIDAGALDLESIPFDPRRVIFECLDLIRHSCAGKGLSLGADIDDAVPQAVAGDPGRLRQVLLNLLTNAVKFTERGSIQVTVAVEGLPATLRIAIADTGIGIPAEAQARLFHRFSQADSSTTRRFGGTGLGLAISKKLVEAMGGSIRVESVPGQGSLFEFTVRLEAADLPAARVAAAGIGQFGARVLVAEDNKTNQRVTQLLLERLGCEVTLARNGAECVSLASRFDFDLILMDCQMPELDGYAATERVRQLPGRSGGLPIVAITASALAEHREACFRAGMNGYLAKPLELQALAQELARFLTPNKPVTSLPPTFADSI